MFKKSLNLLRNLLIGKSFIYMSIADWWSLSFESDMWIVAQNIVFPEEHEINCMLKKFMPSLLEGVDPEYIAKTVLLQRVMRETITNVSLESNGTLTIYFGNREMILPVNTDIVDWQWSLNKTGSDPYHEHIISCFGINQIEIAEELDKSRGKNK